MGEGGRKRNAGGGSRAGKLIRRGEGIGERCCCCREAKLSTAFLRTEGAIEETVEVDRETPGALLIGMRVPVWIACGHGVVQTTLEWLQA
jgi:hypothetical protein|tara:strand:+ start:33518 stop:33787 length:270 start_codon:yes stop_codon:yes gene_type:complete